MHNGSFADRSVCWHALHTGSNFILILIVRERTNRCFLRNLIKGNSKVYVEGRYDGEQEGEEEEEEDEKSESEHEQDNKVSRNKTYKPNRK